MSGGYAIDAFRFAREGRDLRGKLGFAELPRLRESLADGAGEVDYRLEGATDAHRRSVLILTIRAGLPLVCWRCLERVTVPVEQTTRFVLMSHEGDLPAVEDEPEDWTALVASAPLQVRSLVEDELILALPIAPAHGADECRPPPDGEPLAGNEQSPFGALSALKRKKD
jgi:uncharacterized protein